ncbi:hypothetical protein R1sor_020709 [Riccia sorocarpa]|uniref:Uncharacterized protein n=1 Tax=Riccia sorocarpa TaxID=122646 RepID=A0ABD3GFQ3_9MARC
MVDRPGGPRGPLPLVTTAGAVIVGGILAVSFVSSAFLGAFRSLSEANRKMTAPPCRICKGRGFTECRLCKRSSVIHWSPLLDPVVKKPCLCPTCDGNKVQRCLNCVGKGYV